MNLQSFPVEILTEIFSHFHSIDAALALRATCRQFYDLLAGENGKRLVIAAVGDDLFDLDFMTRAEKDGDNIIKIALRYKQTLEKNPFILGPNHHHLQVPFYNVYYQDRIEMTMDAYPEEYQRFLPTLNDRGGGTRFRGFTDEGNVYEIDVAKKTFEVLDPCTLKDKVTETLGKTNPIKHHERLHMPQDLCHMFEDWFNGVQQLTCIYPNRVKPHVYEIYIITNGEISHSWRLNRVPKLSGRWPLHPNKIAAGGGVLAVLYGCMDHMFRFYDLYTGERIAKMDFPNEHKSHDLAMTSTHVWVLDGRNSLLSLSIEDLKNKQYEWNTVCQSRFEYDFYISRQRFYNKFIASNNTDKLLIHNVLAGTYKLYSHPGLVQREAPGIWVIPNEPHLPSFFKHDVMDEWVKLYREKGFEGPVDERVFQENLVSSRLGNLNIEDPEDGEFPLDDHYRPLGEEHWGLKPYLEEQYNLNPDAGAPTAGGADAGGNINADNAVPLNNAPAQENYDDDEDPVPESEHDSDSRFLYHWWGDQRMPWTAEVDEEGIIKHIKLKDEHVRLYGEFPARPAGEDWDSDELDSEGEYLEGEPVEYEFVAGERVEHEEGEREEQAEETH